MIVQTWEGQRVSLLQAVDVEKKIIASMMMLIVAFAGAMIFLILTLLVIEKTRDLGVLCSLGASAGGVISLFLRIGMILCMVGIVLGALSGWALTANINAVEEWIFILTSTSWNRV